MMEDTITSSEMFARLLGLRLTARLEPDVAHLVHRRMNLLIHELNTSQLQYALFAALDYASDLYVLRNPEQAHQQASNIARTVREAEGAA